MNHTIANLINSQVFVSAVGTRLNRALCSCGA